MQIVPVMNTDSNEKVSTDQSGGELKRSELSGPAKFWDRHVSLALPRGPLVTTTQTGQLRLNKKRSEFLLNVINFLIGL